MCGEPQFVVDAFCILGLSVIVLTGARKPNKIKQVKKLAQLHEIVSDVQVQYNPYINQVLKKPEEKQPGTAAGGDRNQDPAQTLVDMSPRYDGGCQGLTQGVSRRTAEHLQALHAQAGIPELEVFMMRLWLLGEARCDVPTIKDTGLRPPV